jgi:hypothetical protein
MHLKVFPNEIVVIIIFLNIDCHTILVNEQYQTIRKIKNSMKYLFRELSTNHRKNI